jgi:hypothetical protein
VFPVQNFPPSFRLDQPERIPSSLEDTDDSTRKTVGAMCRHIRNAQTDPWFLAIAHNLTSSPDLADKIQSVFLFCKAAIKFQRDEQSVWNLYKEINQIDFLIEPRALVRMMPRAYGDCDEFTMFSLACLTALGVPCEIVTVACDPDRPGFWSHVYGQVVLPDGRRMALDCSPAGKYPGWEVPDRDVQRKQAWDLDGNQVSAVASKDLGLHAYIPRRVARRGVGDPMQAGSGEGGIENTIGPTSTPDFNYTPYSGPGAISSGGAPFNWNNFFNSLVGAGTKLGQQAMLPAGSSLLPSGAIISPYGAAGGLLTAGGGLNMSNLLLWGGAAVVLVLVLSAVKK